jgi:hypothetical protein
MVVQAEKVFQDEDTKLCLEVVVKRDTAAVTEALAQLLAAYATHTLVVKGSFVFAVSGDGPLLALMAELPPLLVGKADWTQVSPLGQYMRVPDLCRPQQLPEPRNKPTLTAVFFSPRCNNGFSTLRLNSPYPLCPPPPPTRMPEHR